MAHYQKQIIGGIALVMFSLSHWFPIGFHLLELLSAFAHFTFFISLAIAIGGVFLRLQALSVFAVASMLICGGLLSTHVLSGNTQEKEVNYSVGQFNFYHHNPLTADALNVLGSLNTDIFTIQEMNDDWESSMDSILAEKYPYQVLKAKNTCCYGIGLYSKHPILSSKVIDLEKTPAIIAKVDIEGTVVTIISFHTRPPVAPNETPERNQQLRAISKMVAKLRGNVVVLGDFNIVPWDSEFKRFLRSSGLKRVNGGFQATYPMDIGIPLIPIDHITYSGSLAPTSCKTVTIPGSDHKGLVAGFAFKD